MLYPLDKAIKDKKQIDYFRQGINHYQGRNNTPISFRMAFTYFILADNLGDHRASYMIARMYERGEHLIKSHHNARLFYEKAANKGMYEAYQRLIWIYSISSLDLVKDINRSIYWGEQGIKQGFKLLHLDLGKLYLNKTQEYKMALHHFQKAFYTHDLSEGAYYIAKMYDEGLGVPKNKNISESFMMRSARKGNRDARNNLGAKLKCL